MLTLKNLIDGIEALLQKTAAKPRRFNLVLSAAIVTLALCALVAGLIPAHRAASIEPTEALRME